MARPHQARCRSEKSGCEVSPADAATAGNEPAAAGETQH
jgi:hypothetical protein